VPADAKDVASSDSGSHDPGQSKKNEANKDDQAGKAGGGGADTENDVDDQGDDQVDADPETGDSQRSAASDNANGQSTGRDQGGADNDQSDGNQDADGSRATTVSQSTTTRDPNGQLGTRTYQAPVDPLPDQNQQDIEDDMLIAHGLSQDPSLIEKILANSPDVTKPPRATKMEMATPPLQIEITCSNTTQLLESGMQPQGILDRNRIQSCVRTLSQAMRGREEIIATDRHAKRMNPRRMALESDKPYSVRTEGAVMGPLKVAVIMDLSGSMNGLVPGSDRSAISEGRHFVAVLNELAKNKKIEGVLGLTISHGPESLTQTVRFPLPDEDIPKITAFSAGDGLAKAVDIMTPLIREADLIALYTDGEVTGGSIDKAKLHRQGIYLHGLYIGPMEKSVSLARETDHPIAASTLESLIGRWAQTLMRSGARRRTVE
jgi:hypothetical protein